MTSIAIISLVFIILTFYFTFYKKPKSNLVHFKAQFKATQDMSITLQKKIESYATLNNCWDDLIFENITFRQYLSLMKDKYKENISDDIYKKTNWSHFPERTIESMTMSLEKQFGVLQEIYLMLESKKYSL